MTDQTLERLYQEIGETQQRRIKLDLVKITFVSALLGFGAVQIKDIASFYQVLYVAPLVAVFLDFLVMGEHFSVRRIGAFLRCHPEISKKKKNYEQFVSYNRDKFFVIGSRGFTILSFVAAIALLKATNKSVTLVEATWFGIVFMIYFSGLVVSGCQMANLDKKTSLLPANKDVDEQGNSRESHTCRWLLSAGKKQNNMPCLK